MALRGALFVLTASVVTGCVTITQPSAPIPPVPDIPASQSGQAQYTEVTWEALPGWREDASHEVWPAFVVGCKALTRGASNATWQRVCNATASVDASDPASVRAFFEVNFSPYRITTQDGADQGLVTGYYEPLLVGSRTRSERYRVPLYSPPDDLLTIDVSELYPELKNRRLRGRVVGRRVVPYWARADIDAGRAPVSGHELVFVDDPVEAFFLEIQGSGRIQLEGGEVVRLGYADQNGHPYRAIGAVLAERGAMPIERTSMQNIREWGRRHAAELPELLANNPSYVFFREVPPFGPGSIEASIDGPIGSLGIPLLARRAIAVDTRSVPLGAPVYLATTYPSTTRPLQRLVMAQDTGGAIRGAVRADFFWGFGSEAGQEAGRMRQQGAMWLLWPRGSRPRAQ
ncbi:MAG: MltA domain-containing protein [Pseudomonadota bacterium]|nr:MltA domain-containing protein [Pseudomonadota bacterium]